MIKNKYQKRYYEKNKKKINESSKEYYSKNKDLLNKKKLCYIKKNDYKWEKTPEERKRRYIKRRTRQIYPLVGHKCVFCKEKAEEHHHNTFILEIDKFNFICNKCHRNIHNIVQKGVK